MPNYYKVLKEQLTELIFQTKVMIPLQNLYLDYLINPSFQRLNRFFVLSILDGTVRTRNRRYFLQDLKIIDYNLMINEKKFFDQSVSIDMRTYNT